VDPAYIVLGNHAGPLPARRPGRRTRFTRGIGFVLGVSALVAAVALLGGILPAAVVFGAICVVVIAMPRFMGR